MSHLSRTLDHIVESFGLAVEQKHNVATAGASANGTVDGVHPANVQHKTQGGAIHLRHGIVLNYQRHVHELKL
jgi:hypothetical protein